MSGRERGIGIFKGEDNNGQWTADSEQWTVDSGLWNVDSGRWTENLREGIELVDSGQLPTGREKVRREQRIVDNG